MLLKKITYFVDVYMNILMELYLYLKEKWFKLLPKMVKLILLNFNVIFFFRYLLL
jgi:hypothetical protein